MAAEARTHACACTRLHRSTERARFTTTTTATTHTKQAFLAVSDSEHGRRALFACGVTKICLRWTADIEGVAVNALGTLVNLCADGFEERISAMLDLRAVDRVYEVATTPECQAVKRDYALMLLANMTTTEEGARQAMDSANSEPILRGQRMRRLITSYVGASGPASTAGAVPEEETDSWQHISSVICNISQLQEGRDLLRRRSTNILPQLLPQLESPNVIRRRGVAAAVRNCCYETSDHDWLLSEVGVVPRLLLSLAGPEPLDAPEREGMDPWLLQRLDEAGPNKVREPDPEVRRSMLGAIQLLCTEKASRQHLRRGRVYPIVRNLDQVEDNKEVAEIAFGIINFLVRDEEEGDNEEVLASTGHSGGSAGGCAAEDIAANPTAQQRADRATILEKASGEKFASARATSKADIEHDESLVLNDVD